MPSTLAIENYRSLRNLVIPLGSLTVVTGANGSGKSSLYRALHLLADMSRGGAVAALAREGGLMSTLWAGPETTGRSVREGRHPVQGTRRQAPIGLRLGFSGTDFGYAVDLGLPIPAEQPPRTMFSHDPEIKRECIWRGSVLKPSAVLADRHNAAVRTRDTEGAWSGSPQPIRPFDSMLSEFADPRAAPEVLRMRERVRGWRFYDHFRADSSAPARSRRIGTRTPVLGQDGSDVAAALQTIREIGDESALTAAVEHAFPGSEVQILEESGWFELRLRQHGLLRPLGVAELSDGTLRYLLLVAALLSPRPPELLVLNEPETSLHPELLPPLARLILVAAELSQIVVVSHSRPLIAALDAVAAETRTEVNTVELVKEFGQTTVEGQGRLDKPAWHWPKR